VRANTASVSGRTEYSLFMSSRPRARPRFTLDLPLSPEQVVERVRARMAASDAKVTGSLFRRTMLLTVRKQDSHFWSPQLDVQLEDAPGGGTRLAAMFAPHPQIWTSFVAVQFLFALLSVAAAIYLISAMMLGRDLVLPAGLLGLMLFGGGFAYGAAYVGQGFGSEQMYELRAFLDAAVTD
jgi:hypothetical protein